MWQGKNKIDWLEIRKTYITGKDITLQELANIFGVSFKNI